MKDRKPGRKPVQNSIHKNCSDANWVKLCRGWKWINQLVRADSHRGRDLLFFPKPLQLRSILWPPNNRLCCWWCLNVGFTPADAQSGFWYYTALPAKCLETGVVSSKVFCLWEVCATGFVEKVGVIRWWVPWSLFKCGHLGLSLPASWEANIQERRSEHWKKTNKWKHCNWCKAENVSRKWRKAQWDEQFFRSNKLGTPAGTSRSGLLSE